jgi:hypothetical protein
MAVLALVMLAEKAAAQQVRILVAVRLAVSSTGG